MQDVRNAVLRARVLVFALSTFGVLAPGWVQAQTVSAMWDPNPSADQVTAYQVCIGTSSRSCNKHSNSVSSGQTSFTFTPTPQVLHYVAVRAINASGQGAYSAERTFSIPAFTQPANQSSTVGVAISPLDLVVNDADGSPRQFTHTGLPVGLTLNSATGRITGTPAAAGTHNVTVFVNDGLVTVSRSFTWTVNPAAVVDQTGPALTITSHTSGQNVAATSLTLAGTASDSGRGNTGIASVTVNGQPATGGAASGTGTANWSRMISLSTGANVISVRATDGAGNVTTQQITLMRTAPMCQSHDDSDGDCRADLVWRNSVSGQILVWYLNGTTVLGDAWLPTVTDLTWQLAVSADLNQDGVRDLVWRNTVSGHNLVWYMNGTTVRGEEWLPTVADPTWQLATSADINRDGARDLIWRNTASGDNLVWYMRGATVLGYAWLPIMTDSAWQLAASADLNQDGSADLIWRNTTTGENNIWYLDGTAKIGESALQQVNSKWRLMAAADTDGDGTADLIWRNTSTGANDVWYLNGASFARSAWLPTVSDQTWTMLGSR